MIEAEYYYLDKDAEHPLKLLSDMVALRPSSGTRWEELDRLFSQLMEGKSAAAEKSRIAVYQLPPNKHFRQVEDFLKEKGFSADVFPVFMDASGSLVILTDQIIVRFEAGTDKDAIDKLLQENGLEIVSKSRFAPNQYVLRLVDASVFKVLDIINALNKLELVVFAHPNLLNQFWKE